MQQYSSFLNSRPKNIVTLELETNVLKFSMERKNIYLNGNEWINKFCCENMSGMNGENFMGWDFALN